MSANVFERVQASFAQQQFMTTLGATLLSVNPGAIEIELPSAPTLPNRTDSSMPARSPASSTQPAATRP